MKIGHIFTELLNEDFKSQTLRYIKQGIEPDIVKSYIDKFKHIRDKKYKEMFDSNLNISVPPDKRNNIDVYNDFHELEQLVDYVSGQRQGISKIGGEEIEVDGKPVYKDENFEVYYADNPRACIKYKGKFPYSWCVARSDSSNMFYTYRFKPYEPAFYFIKDIKSAEKEFGIWNMSKNVFKGSFKNPYHFFVIQVPKNVNIEDNNTAQYIVTSANNDGDKQMSWNDILKLNRNIAPIHDVLKPKPFTPQEKKQHERFKNGISDDEFRKLSYEDKRNYLDIYPTIARPITSGQLMALPDDLLNLYVSFGIGLDDEQFDYIKPKKDILKRYAQISKRKLEEYLKNDNYSRRQLRMGYTELIVLDDSDIKSYLDSLSQKEINEFINNYGEDKFDFLEKHMPNKFSSEFKSMKQLLIAGNNDNDEALTKLQELVPDDIEVKFNNDYIIIDTYPYGNYLEKNLDSSIRELFEHIEHSGGGYRYNDSYFDGDNEGLENTYDSELEDYINNNPDIGDKFKSYGLSWNLDIVKDLLETYKKDDNIKSAINDAYSSAKQNAEETESDNIRDEIRNIVFIDDNTEVHIKLGPFIMFLTGKEFFNTDRQIFIDNVINLLENILSGYDVEDNVDRIYERVNEAGYNFGNIDTYYINRKIEDGIEEAIDNFGGEDEYEVNDDSGDGENVAKLKSQIIQYLNDTLKKLGKDPFTSHIENDIVSIDINRQKFNPEGKVYVKLTDKKTKESHEGYVNIKDLPSYFTNYKLFEQMLRIKSLIKY